MNAAQRAAVERWGQDVCVVAGPGSGKTRVLIERFRWLVETQGIAPGRILAVTFTDKAATEIKKRLIQAFAASDALREEIERAWVSTIHGFCTRLLKENAIAARLDPDFRLLEEAQSQHVQLRLAEAALDDLWRRERAAVRTLLSQLDTGGAEIAQGLVDLYEELRTAGVPVEAVRLPQQPEDTGWAAIVQAARVILTDPVNGTPRQRESHQEAHRWARDVLTIAPDAGWKEFVALCDRAPRASALSNKSRARTVAQELKDTSIPATLAALILKTRHELYPLCLEALVTLHREYSAWKRVRGLIDFNDLEEHAIALLESGEELRERVRGRFDQVLMDELQDTNRLQWRLIDLVRRPDRLFAVGDINQSIYYFRHADPGVFRSYRDALAASGGVIDELRENYRSRTAILNAVNAVTPYLAEGVEPHTLVARREFAQTDGACIEFTHTFAANDEDDAARIEALWIARRIRELEIAGEARFSQIAVLARTIAALAPVQQALDEFGVPSIVTGGRSFYEAREVRDLIAWLAAVANPLDEVSLATIMRSPLVGASDEELLRLKLAAPRLVDTLQAERPAWFEMLQGHRAQADAWPPDRFLSEALDASGYETALPARGRANIAKLLAALRERWHREPAPVAEIVAELALWREAETEAEAAADEVSNSVRLMSVHAAKGLEFPVVFLAAMRSGGQNRKPVFCFDETRTLGASWRHPVAKGGIPDPVHLAVSAVKKRQEDGEEDRLLYVAMTRAEQRLICSASTGGQGSWAKRVSEGLGLPTGNPKQVLRDTAAFRGGLVELLHTSEAASAAGLPALAEPESDVIEIIQRPAWVEQHETALPVTSVAQFAFCPRQYYLARYLRWPGAETPAVEREETERSEWTASDFGTMVHELLAGIARPDAPPEALAMRDQFEASPLGRRAANAIRAEREYDFLIEIEGAILRGQIDLWFEDKGEILLVDYKTDRVDPGEEHRHARRYVPQLRLYALALEKLTGRVPARAVLWYLRTGAAVSVSLTREDLETARAGVGELMVAQSELRFPLREGKHCLRCSYYHGACPAVVPEEDSMSAAAAPISEV